MSNVYAPSTESLVYGECLTFSCADDFTLLNRSVSHNTAIVICGASLLGRLSKTSFLMSCSSQTRCSRRHHRQLHHSEGLEGMKIDDHSLRRAFRLPRWPRCERADPSLLMLCSFKNQALVQLSLFMQD